MNWKNWMEKLETGDRVRVIKRNPLCNNCPNCEEKYVGNEFTIYMVHPQDGEFGPYTIRGCNFPKECLVKV